MLEAPDVQGAQIMACREAAYGWSITEVAFLPRGADVDTAVSRVVADDTTPYCLQLRRGRFPDVTVTIPPGLADAGMPHLIARPSPHQPTGA